MIMISEDQLQFLEDEARKRIKQAVPGGHCSMMTVSPFDILTFIEIARQAEVLTAALNVSVEDGA
jgi:hypothetical protein